MGAAALWGVLWVAWLVAYTAQPPGPTTEEIDPCCGKPETWGAVVEGGAWTAGFTVLDGLLFALSVALVRHSVRDRWPRRRWVVLGPVLYALVAIATIAVAQLVQL